MNQSEIDAHATEVVRAVDNHVSGAVSDVVGTSAKMTCSFIIIVKTDTSVPSKYPFDVAGRSGGHHTRWTR